MKFYSLWFAPFKYYGEFLITNPSYQTNDSKRSNVWINTKTPNKIRFLVRHLDHTYTSGKGNFTALDSWFSPSITSTA